MIGAIELSRGTTGATNPVERPASEPKQHRHGESEAAEATDRTSSGRSTREEVSQVAAKLQETALSEDKNLNFTVDDKTGDIVIQVTDGESGEVIRTIPSESALNAKEALSSVSGLLFSEES